MKRETRSIKAELRAISDESGKHLSGYAAKYNVLSTMLHDPAIGEFYEVILPGAFAEAVKDDVTCNIDHDDVNNFLGRTPDSLTLTDDNEGLFFDCLLPDNTEPARKIIAHCREDRKDITKCSFAFDVLDESWDVTEEGCPLRQLNKVKLYDVAAVIRPAYDFDTELSVRSRELAKPKAIDHHATRRKLLDLAEKS